MLSRLANLRIDLEGSRHCYSLILAQVKCAHMLPEGNVPGGLSDTRTKAAGPTRNSLPVKRQPDRNPQISPASSQKE